MQRNFAAACAALLLLGLAGCTAAPETTSTPEAAPAEESVSEAAPTATPEAQPAVTLEETELYNQDGVRITATGLDTKGLMGPELGLQIENDTEKNLVIQSAWTTVNGYMMSDLLSADVAAGKKANETMYFPSSSLERCGIDTIAEIGTELKIIDGDTYQTLITTGPLTLQTSAAGSYTQTYDDSGEEIYNANGIRVVVQDQSEDLFGQAINFYVENTSDRNIVVESEDVSVNGYMITNLFYADVIPGAHAVEELTLLGSELEESNITDIETVELALKIVDADTFQTIEKTAPITLQGNQS